MSTAFNVRNEDLEQLSAFSDATFNLEYSIEQAKDILTELQALHPENICSFDRDEWRLLEVRTSTYVHFKFETVRNKATFQKELDSESFMDIIKAWTANLLSKFAITTVYHRLVQLENILYFSNFFSSTQNSQESLMDKLYGESDYNRYYMCTAALNFIDFCEKIDEQMIYTNLLDKIREEVKLKPNVRELPSPKDVMIFANVLEDFFSKISIPSLNYFRYFPIYLWWNLTNIIPIRPSEFCMIKRDGLFKEEGKFYIKLPRSSKGNSLRKNRNRIQIVDTFRIPSEIGEKLEQYIELTTPFGSSKTLISYLAWDKAGSKGRGTQKIIKDSYSVPVLDNHLDMFHNEIIQNEYGISIRPYNSNLVKDIKILQNEVFDMNRALRPGDTRHFAFINLMRQGFHPVEIARLGGHVELSTQYHYHQHVDYFMDTEILKLMSKFKFKYQNYSNEQNILGPSILGEGSNTEQEFKKKFVFKLSSEANIKRKLKDGYCIEPNQNCPVDECLMCDYWRIDIDEYNEKKEIIKSRAAEVYDDTKKIMGML
ncbi:hypothetical protein COF72_14880, partial [Bacillus pseudomycoides]|uniref:site-specific integrase n=1 Tax=Bacillus pseudomycoides TaxID=64104 RepID=UPI000BFD4688